MDFFVINADITLFTAYEFWCVSVDLWCGITYFHVDMHSAVKSNFKQNLCRYVSSGYVDTCLVGEVIYVSNNSLYMQSLFNNAQADGGKMYSKDLYLVTQHMHDLMKRNFDLGWCIFILDEKHVSHAGLSKVILS